MGYEVVLYITRNEDTENFFHRFQKVRIKDRLWEVQFQDDITSDTMLIVYMKETFENQFEVNDNKTDDYREKEELEQNPPVVKPEGAAAIVGERFIAYPYDELEFAIENADGGT